jgi:hypothetical protein
VVPPISTMPTSSSFESASRVDNALDTPATRTESIRGPGSAQPTAAGVGFGHRAMLSGSNVSAHNNNLFTPDSAHERRNDDTYQKWWGRIIDTSITCSAVSSSSSSSRPGGHHSSNARGGDVRGLKYLLEYEVETFGPERKLRAKCLLTVVGSATSSANMKVNNLMSGRRGTPQVVLSSLGRSPYDLRLKKVFTK